MKYSVLIVEDDPMVAMINEQYVLKNTDFYVVTTCRNGKDAIDFLEKNKVDLIVLDVYMPVMDGIETLKAIRDRKIPSEVIMVTAANDSETLEKTMHLGVIDYLIKPFAFERFQVALEKFASKVSTLKQNKVLDQNCIDSIITSSKSTKEKDLPKGIQEKTLSTILGYFEKQDGWHSSEIIAERLGFSIVTVRHYMNYLVDSGKIIADINYETGGRPCMLYRKK